MRRGNRFSRPLRLISGLHASSRRSFASTIDSNCVVNSHNEFDLLEEVIVGRVEGATIPEWHVSGKAVWPQRWSFAYSSFLLIAFIVSISSLSCIFRWDMFKTKSGQPFPAELMTKAAAELDNFAKILEAEGVKVRRPDVLQGKDFAQSYSTPDFSCSNGLYAAMPRDVLIVVGNEIIESPMVLQRMLPTLSSLSSSSSSSSSRSSSYYYCYNYYYHL